MLQFIRIQSAVETNPPSAEVTSPAEVVTTFVQFVHRQFPIIALLTLLTTALATIYLLITPASYNAQATLIIDSRRPGGLSQSWPGGETAADAAIVSSQVEILKSGVRPDGRL